MVIHDLTRDECSAVLARATLGRLGCSHFDQPYIVPIYFSFDADYGCVYGFSTIGQKVQWMRRNPRVCLEVDEIVDRSHWTTVLLVGRYQEIHRDPRWAEARRRAEQLFAARQEWWLPGAAQVTTRPHEFAVIFRIGIDRLTGRRAGTPAAGAVIT